MSNSAESIDLAETNRIRLSLGLAPLADPAASAPVQTEEDVAVENFRQIRDAEASERAAKELQGRLDKARNQKELKAKLVGKSLGEGEDNEGARAWVKKTKKSAAAIQAELARKRQAEQEELDRDLQAKYDESSLAGLKVAHDMDSFKEGDSETILTLKDTRILDGEDDELVNVNMADQERLEERLDLRKKGKSAGKYTGYDDDEFQTGSSGGVLSKYDVDIKDDRKEGSSVGFRLGAGTRQDDEAATGFEAVARPVVRDKQEVAKELQRTLADLNYTKNLDVSDYVQEGDAGFKKLKKKKKPSKSTRKAQIDEADPSEMQVDEPVQTSLQDLENQALVDDEELQAALARTRREKNKKALSALKRNAEAAALAAQSAMEVDGTDSPAAIKEESDDGGEDTGLVLDATSEFVRGIQLQPVEPRKASSTPAPPSAPVKEETPLPEDQPLAEMDLDAQPSAAAEEAVKQEEDEVDAFGGTAAEVSMGRGIGSTLSLLRQQGLMKPLTEEERKKDEEYKQKQAWLAQRRNDEMRILEQKANSRAAGTSKDQKTRELENRQREKEQAQRDLDRFKAYKPNIDIKYNDEFGREMTPKEAWKHLSHRFHGKGSGIKQQEKRLKKIADEQKRESMLSGDTPLSTNAAFQARQEKLGSATMILSVGNKMTAPGLEDFQTTGGLNPAKASTSKSSKKKGAQKAQPAPEVNLTPSINVPVAPAPALEATPELAAPQPKKAGFQRINKRPAEEQEGAAAKRLKADS